MLFLSFQPTAAQTVTQAEWEYLMSIQLRWVSPVFPLLFQEEMNTWIQAISSAISSDKHEVSASTQSTPASSRAPDPTCPTSVVTITSESVPANGRGQEKDKEKRFSLFGKKWTPFCHFLPFSSYLFSEIQHASSEPTHYSLCLNVSPCGWFFSF